MLLLKGGVGKIMIIVILGVIFVDLCGDWVVVVDVNFDCGILS